MSYTLKADCVMSASLPPVLLMDKFNNASVRKHASLRGKEEKGMNSKKAKAIRRAVKMMAAQGKIKTEGYAQRSDTGAIVARGERGAYQRLKKVVK